MRPKIHLTVAKPHPGQARILAAAGKYNCIRPGRRFGKTEMGVELAQQMILAGYPVGWFAPEAKYHTEGWERVLRRLKPLLLPHGQGGTDKSTGVWTARFVGGGTFECWSLHNNQDAGRSRKYKRIIVDEAGLVKGLLDWWNMAAVHTLLDMDGDAFLLGTPKLSGRGFNQLFKRGERGDSEWRSFKGKTIENTCIPGVEAWVAKRRAEMPDWQAAQEFDGEAADSVQGFFGDSMIETYIEEYSREPLHRGNLVVPHRYHAERDAILTHQKIELLEWQEDPRGGWKLWFPVKRGKPGITCRSACTGADIGCGVGSSNSVITAGDSDTGEVIAEYASSGDSPEELARINHAFGLWIGQGRPARINFEGNGPGEQFIKVLMENDYANIHTRRKSPVKVQGGTAAEYGWWNTPASKFSLLSEYRGALHDRRILHPSHASVEECLTYHIDELNRVVSEREMAEADEETGAKIPHGDRVISSATLWQAMLSNPISEPDQPEPPRGSFAWRQRQAELEAESRR